MMRSENYRRLVNIKNRLQKIKGSTLIKGYLIIKIKIYGKRAFMVKRINGNVYKIYDMNNIFQAAQDISSQSVYTFVGERI